MPRNQTTHTLCQKYMKLDFEKILCKPISFQSLGTWGHVRKSTRCSFCRLVTACLESRGPQAYLEHEDRLLLGNELAWERSVMTLFYDGERSGDYSNKFDLKDKAAQSSSKPAQRLVITRGRKRVAELQFVATHERGDQKLFFGRKVNQKEVNWPLLRSWLPECENFHQGLCDKRGKSARDLPENLRVIDLDTGKIITAPARCRYCAMTYVWGPIRREGILLKQDWLRRDHNGVEYAELPSNLPRTIVDSMTVARQLGFRYLWNDSLCIIQGPQDGP